ncbi:hypothetical protein ACIQ1H_04940 [Lysinibacillus sp. NPDC097279]|uniref:hypothetical protein n=1 Tax=Lysinibacillus sp. NPDC097279 TaxID=3364143 RepID=UPI003830AF69
MNKKYLKGITSVVSSALLLSTISAATPSLFSGISLGGNLLFFIPPIILLPLVMVICVAIYQTLFGKILPCRQRFIISLLDQLPYLVSLYGQSL